MFGFSEWWNVVGGCGKSLEAEIFFKNRTKFTLEPGNLKKWRYACVFRLIIWQTENIKLNKHTKQTKNVKINAEKRHAECNAIQIKVVNLIISQLKWPPKIRFDGFLCELIIHYIFNFGFARCCYFVCSAIWEFCCSTAVF